MPKFLAPIEMVGNNIDLGGGSILNANIPQITDVLSKLDAIALSINALKPKRVKKKTTKKVVKKKAKATTKRGKAK